VRDCKLTEWKVEGREEPLPPAHPKSEESAKASLLRNFEFRLPLTWLLANPVVMADSEGSGTVSRSMGGAAAVTPTGRLRLRFSLWHNGLPVDALPVEGWIELQLVSEWELAAGM
jgi:hypothetical protein